MNKAYRYRLMPNKKQEEYFCKVFGCVRFVYNKMLEDRIDYYRETKKSLNNTPAQYKGQYPFLKEVDSLALANAQINLNKAYKNFFTNTKIGFPNFKSIKRLTQSYQTNNLKGSIRVESGKVKLPKIGWVKLVYHREIPIGHTIKTVTIKRLPSGKYYISLLTEYEKQIPMVEPQKYLGLDFSMHSLYVSSEGVDVNYPRFFRKNQKKLARVQRKLSRCKDSSQNRKKAKIRIAKVHEKIANQRNNFLHNNSTEIANSFDVVSIENISVKAMAKHHKKGFHFGKSVYDNGWAKFVSMLSYKLAERGKKLITIDKWYASSQTCHVCGYINKETKNLSIREWDCPLCYTHHNRDVNAAINIREEGKRIA